MRIPRTGALVLACAATVAGCRGEMNATLTDRPTLTFEQITPAQWERLANSRILFAHQSVGGNVLDGVADILRERSDIGLNVVEIKNKAQVNGPAFYHAVVGRNGEPSSKLNAFNELVSEVGDSGIALLKYCYADFSHGTDANQLFEEYRHTVASIRARHPRLQIVHVTVPLVTDAGTLRHFAAVVRSKPPARDVNFIRHQYNELMRRTYQGKEPIFDLARLESTNVDGTPIGFRYKGQRVDALAPAWTTDGGHLNEAARRQFAKTLLVTLASVYDEAS